MKGAIMRVIQEWRAVPWTPRARRIGRTLEAVVGGLLLVFAPALVEAVVNALLPIG